MEAQVIPQIPGSRAEAVCPQTVKPPPWGPDGEPGWGSTASDSNRESLLFQPWDPVHLNSDCKSESTGEF